MNSCSSIKHGSLFASIVGVMLLFGGVAESGAYIFTNVADTNMSGPDVPFFDGFSDFPVINNSGTVAFRATADGSAFRLFSAPAGGGGPYIRVASDDYSLELPFDPLIDDSGTVAFYAWEKVSFSPTDYSILTAPADGNGSFKRIVSTATGDFSSIDGPALSNSGAIAFVAAPASGGKVLYTIGAAGGAFTPVADTTGIFSGFGGISINSSGTVAFRGILKAGGSGIFAARTNGSSPAVTVAGSGNGFSQFRGQISINDLGKVVFHATTNVGTTGIFSAPAAGGGPVTTIADSTGPFSDFIRNSSGIYGDHVAMALNNRGAVVFFAKLKAGGFGLFTGPDPAANKIIASGDILFDSSVTDLAFFAGSLNDKDQLAFYYRLADGREGIAVATPGDAPPLPSDSALIPITTRRDMVFDHGGRFLYISASDGMIHTYDLAASRLGQSYNVGGTLNGIDIAPDDSFLLVAQGNAGPTTGTFQKVSLPNGQITNITYNLTPYEAGAWDIAITSNGTAFGTTQAHVSGWVPLRQIDLSTGTITTRNDLPAFPPDGVGIRTQIQRSADGTRLYLLEGNSFPGPVFTYDSTTNTFGPSSQNDGFNDFISAAVNRNGALLVTRTYQTGASLTTAPNFQLVHNFREVDSGVAFDATRDILYGVSKASNDVVAYDTNTFAEKFRLHIGEDVRFVRAIDEFDTGVLVASADGRYLALETPMGVRLFNVPQPSVIPTPTPPPPPATAAPVISPSGGVFKKKAKFSITCPTPAAVIHYTIDGGPPTSSSAVFPAPVGKRKKVPLVTITGKGDHIVEAFASAPDFSDSEVVSATFTLLK